VSTYKRGKWYWLDAVVNDVRYRVPLKTKDWRAVSKLEQSKLEELKKQRPDPAKRAKAFGSMTFREAVDAYIAERRSKVSPGMVAYWKAQSPPLVGHFKTPLKKITLTDILDYQNKRLDKGRAPKTVNGEISVLRQVLKHAKIWYRFEGDYEAIPNDKPPVGQAITEEEQKRLFETAALWKPGMPKLVIAGKDGKTYKIRPNWMFAYVAATLAFYLGMRSVEIRNLKWKDVDFAANLLGIRISKTPAGWRTPTLNEVSKAALIELYDAAKVTTGAEPEHFVFPSRGADPTRPMKSWRSAWRSLRTAAGLEGLRMHDGRHTAVTTLCEKGLSDWVIQAQVGHVDAKMLKTYSHSRRRALDEAAAALQPSPHITAETTQELVN
jgi:integrase